jgi:DNA-binding CsgD family transcriptional regulator
LLIAVEAAPPLTDKQREVMRRIDRRMPIKLIANEMGVSETRINQHIRALKRIYDAGSLNELVETHRLSEHRAANDGETKSADSSSGFGFENVPEPGVTPPLRNVACTKKQMGEGPPVSDQSNRDDPGSIRLSDAHVVARDAPWAHDIEPVVVFGALDGRHAVLYRFVVMVGLAFGMIAGVVLVVSAALSLSEVLDGRAAVPTENIAAADQAR